MKISGEALSNTLVIISGLCTRWPVGWPDCGSRRMITWWLNACTRIWSSWPSWKMLPTESSVKVPAVIEPCLVPS